MFLDLPNTTIEVDSEVESLLSPRLLPLWLALEIKEVSKKGLFTSYRNENLI